MHIREREARAGVAAGVHPAQIILSVKDVLPLLHKGKTVAADTALTRMRHSGYKAVDYVSPFRFSGLILTPEPTPQGIELPWREHAASRGNQPPAACYC